MKGDLTMNTLTIILIVLTIVLLIANIVIFTTDRKTTKQELTFDKSRVKIVLFASEDEDKIIKEEINMLKKYHALDSAIGSLKTEQGYIYIRAYLVEIK